MTFWCPTSSPNPNTHLGRDRSYPGTHRDNLGMFYRMPPWIKCQGGSHRGTFLVLWEALPLEWSRGHPNFVGPDSTPAARKNISGRPKVEVGGNPPFPFVKFPLPLCFEPQRVSWWPRSRPAPDPGLAAQSGQSFLVHPPVVFRSSAASLIRTSVWTWCRENSGFVSSQWPVVA